MSSPKTLLEMAGADLRPAPLSQSTVVVIDAQYEYLDGKLPLPGIKPALAAISQLLAKARDAGAPVVHIAHKGRPGGLFDRDGHGGKIIDAASPQGAECVIEKPLPNAFAQTSLDAELKAIGRTSLVIAGFMTHMCVSSTARAALDLGYRVTIAGDAAATRDLPDPLGGVISAESLHRAALAALGDRFAVISTVAQIPSA